MILRRDASWCDVTTRPDGSVAWALSTDVGIEVWRIDTAGNADLIWRRSTPERLLYIRAASDHSGLVTVVGQGHQTGKAWASIHGGPLIDLGTTHGVFPVEIHDSGGAGGWTIWVMRPGKGDLIALRQSGQWAYFSSFPSDTSQGFLQAPDRLLQDLYRHDVPGVVLAERIGNVAIGQNADQGVDRLRFIDTSGQQRPAMAYRGYAQPPHLAQLGPGFAACAWTEEGAWFEYFATIPWGVDPGAPPPPVEWHAPGEGREVDLWPLVQASASAMSPDGSKAYLSKSNTDPLRAEWWGLSADGSAIEHLEDRSRVDGIDPGWFLRNPFWCPRRVRAGQTWENRTEIFDRVTGTWRPFAFTATAHVAKSGTIAGAPITVRLDFDNRPPADATGRRSGRVEWFWFTSRWHRWTELWDDPAQPGENLSIVIGQDGLPRDFVSDPPTLKDYVPCPRPNPLPPPNPQPEPEPMPFRPVPRDQLLNVIAWLRDEIYPGLLGEALNDEGIASWVCDNYVRYRQDGVAHEDAKHRVFADIQRSRVPASPLP